MRSMGQTCNPQCLCGFIVLGVIIPHSSILLTIPVAFIYKSPYHRYIVGRGLAPAVCLAGIYGRTQGPALHNFSNCDVSICDKREFIL